MVIGICFPCWTRSATRARAESGLFIAVSLVLRTAPCTREVLSKYLWNKSLQSEVGDSLPCPIAGSWVCLLTYRGFQKHVKQFTLRLSQAKISLSGLYLFPIPSTPNPGLSASKEQAPKETGRQAFSCN